MPDIFTKAKRSLVMARIRSRGNKDTELALAKLFRRQGISGWRRHLEVSGEKAEGRGQAAVRTSHPSSRPFRVRPDFVFPKLRLTVFVDGCFWHACPRHTTKPRSNVTYWRRKFAANRARDRRVNRALRRAGWRVLRIWEHELAKRREARLVARIRQAFDSPS